MDELWSSFLSHWRYVVDLSTFAFCSTLVTIYQVRLLRRIRLNPSLTIQGMNAQARGAWVQRVMDEGKIDITSVQTFRNSMMAATLMASTAVILIFSILNMLASADKVGPALHGLNPWGSHEPGIWIFKLMLLVVAFFVAFFAFSLAVRGYHHAGYLINVPVNKGKHGVTPAKVTQLLHRTSKYYMIGMRAYYFSVLLVLWLFGPLWMFLGTVILLAILNHLDHLPN